MPDFVLDLPLHPLVVHAVVVLVPLTAIGGVLSALWPSFSRRFGVLVVVLGGAATVAAVVARQAGYALDERVPAPSDHERLGTWVPLVVFVLFLAVLALWLLDRGTPRDRPRRPVTWVAAVAVVLSAVLATGWVIVVGHSGSGAVWSGVVNLPPEDD
ncbi:MAG: hypothetical protein EPO13_09795 [Actinomycetota bacterium]|nr:MAG: hypothetical protein EPO13_09795 [Actinomycetota bacterium]